MNHTHEGRPSDFVPDPKPTNFDAMTAVWDDSAAFRVEVAKYREQVAGYHADRRAGVV